MVVYIGLFDKKMRSSRSIALQNIKKSKLEIGDNIALRVFAICYLRTNNVACSNLYLYGYKLLII